MSETGDQPSGRTLTFSKGKTVSNSAIVGLGMSHEAYVVRVFAAATGHVSLDLTGVSVVFNDHADTNARRSSRTSVERVVKAVRSVRR